MLQLTKVESLSWFLPLEPHIASFFILSIFENHETTWHPPVLWIGIGCERNTSKELIANSLNNFLESSDISPHSVAGFATIDIKKDEKGILELAEESKLPIKFFTKEDLSKIIVPNPSSIVQKEIGTSSVAEASAILAAQALAVGKDLGWDDDRLNVNGGAIAIGHPIGASGARILTTLLYEMEKRDSSKGLATLCIGGGMGIAMCVARD